MTVAHQNNVSRTVDLNAVGFASSSLTQNAVTKVNHLSYSIFFLSKIPYFAGYVSKYIKNYSISMHTFEDYFVTNRSELVWS